MNDPGTTTTADRRSDAPQQCAPDLALEAAIRVANHLDQFTYRWADERELQRAIEDALRCRFVVQAEVSLSRQDRPDFVVTTKRCHVAIEVKVRGTRNAILRQLGRYAAHDNVHALILAAGRRTLLPGIPTHIHGKPVLVVHTKAPLR